MRRIDTHKTLLNATGVLAQLQSPDGSEAFSALFGRPYLLLELACATANELEQLRTAIVQLPCPVIALGEIPEAATSLVDTVVATEKDARVLGKNIERHPLTAMTLVQLLRHNEDATITDGLLAESLAYATLQGGQEFKNFLAARKHSANPLATSQPAVLCQRQGDHLEITLNQPERRNAFSVAMRDGLVSALQLLRQDPAIAGASIRGAGECFCIGGDLDEFGLVADTTTAHAIRSTRNAGRLLAEQSDRIQCYVHRACIGAGIELPAFCHRVIASKDTYFQLPEISLGLVPGAGGTVSVLHRIGRHRTTWLALSGKRINASKALEWGLIDAIE